jgi:hypothetical protein
MASVRKRGRVYHYRFKDADGVWVSRAGLPSREATLKIALAAEERARMEREGLLDPAREAARTGLDELLDRWETWFKSLGRTPEHVRRTIVQAPGRSSRPRASRGWPSSPRARSSRR